ncbi:MAG: Crp/Fnr family transcriptional regulator [Acidobacteria bacterium]|nr:Crp/Fnr family transcriptional regulator [Acidobacteriota bacterium]
MSPSSRHLVATLHRVPLFAELSDQQLESIGARIIRAQFERDSTIFSEGDLCRELLIVEEGSVKLLKNAANGRQQLMGIERTGSTLAEVPVFDGGRYTVTALVNEPTVLLRFAAEHFRKVCLQQPEVAVKVIKALGHRLRHMERLVEELSFSTVRGRLISHLLRLAEERGTRDQSSVYFELNENNEELAARLGTVRELISRNLGRLHGDGLIEMRRRIVRIPNAHKLESEAR